MNKRDIIILSDKELIDHNEKYKRKLSGGLKRDWVLQFTWSKEEIEKRGLNK